MNLQERLNNIKDYFQSMELMEGRWFICVKYNSKWGAFSSEDGKIKVAPHESNPNIYWYYSEDEGTSIDDILDLIEETIKTNLEAIKKVELFKIKGEELKRLFSDENITFKQLQTLKFVMEDKENTSIKSRVKQKATKPRKLTTKKDLLKVNDVEITEKEEAKEVIPEINEPRVHENPISEPPMMEVNNLSSEEIDKLRG